VSVAMVPWRWLKLKESRVCAGGARGGGGVEHKLPHLLSFINPAVLIVMLPWKRRKLKEPEAYLWAHAGEGSV
jgi:hypothetical protein